MPSFPIKVALVIAVWEPHPSPNSKFLLVDNRVPARYLEHDQTTKKLAEDILYKYTGVEAFYTIILPLGVVEQPDSDICVLYAVFFSEATRIRVDGSAWVEYSQLKVDDYDRKLITEALERKI